MFGLLCTDLGSTPGYNEILVCTENRDMGINNGSQGLQDYNNPQKHFLLRLCAIAFVPQH